jgi:hypothetical protein
MQQEHGCAGTLQGIYVDAIIDVDANINVDNDTNKLQKRTCHSLHYATQWKRCRDTSWVHTL